MFEESRQILHNVLKESVKLGWDFFIVRSLYALAHVEKTAKAPDRMKTTLEILQSFIDEKESVYLAHLINEQFKEESFAIKLPISFDNTNMRFTIDGQTIALHEKPLLFNFLQLLSRESQFVSKEKIAKTLWAEEYYHPNIHDARIFDIAKRARGLIEKYEEQPVILLSGRLGYKLATRLEI
jgi:DNA-binding response OmpR family regulator